MCLDHSLFTYLLSEPVLTPHERLLIAWITPRGIVAASVAGLFSPQLIEKGYAGAELLLPLVFALIILTVILHGLSIGLLAKKWIWHRVILMD